MRRRLTNFLGAASLVLCVATVALWTRGYWAAEGWVLPVHGRVAHVMSVRDGIYVAWFVNFELDGAVAAKWSRQPANGVDAVFEGGMGGVGFRYVRRDGRRGDDGASKTFHAAFLPHWATLVAAAGTFALCRWRSTAPRRRASRGLCHTCGYDLRASPGRCPECGAAPRAGDAVAAAPPDSPCR